MKILFLADPSPNLENWISGIKNVDSNVDITVRSLQFPSDLKSKVLRFLQWIELIFVINKIVENGKYDIVIGYRIPSYGFLASFIKNKKVVIAAQGATDIWPPEGLAAKLKTILFIKAVKRADVIHAWGNEMKLNINKIYSLSHKILLMPRGIDTNIFNTNYRLNNFSIDLDYRYTFITTRSLSKDYNHTKLIKAFYEFKKFDIPFLYYIAGTGGLEASLKILVKELNLEKEVKFLGKLNSIQLSDYYQKSDVYISIPLTEGVSASLFEAMACGCYPILSNLPSYDEFIVNRKNGTILKNLEPKAISWEILNSIGSQDYLGRASTFNIELVNKIADSRKNMKTFLEKYRELCAV